MANLRIIKRRIRSVSGIRQITRAMEMVSATKLKKALARVEHARPYFECIDQVFDHLIASVETNENVAVHPLMRRGDENGDILLVVVGSDKGLCGSFNTNIIRETWKFINSELKEPLIRKFDPVPGEIEVSLHSPEQEPVTFKGQVDARNIIRSLTTSEPSLDYPGLYHGQIIYKPSEGSEKRFELTITISEDTSGPVVKHLWSPDLGINFPYTGSLKISRILNEINIANKKIYVLTIGKKIYDAISRVKNPRVRIVDPILDINQAIPLTELTSFSRRLNDLFITGVVSRIYMLYTEYKNAARQVPKLELYLPLEAMSGREKETQRDYIFEPSPGLLFMNMIPAYARIKVFKALAHSFTSEHSIRMNAMRNATDNASELIDTLTLARNKARQAAITKELSEIVGGAEALKG